jgi:hypothetical protein
MNDRDEEFQRLSSPTWISGAEPEPASARVPFFPRQLTDLWFSLERKRETGFEPASGPASGRVKVRYRIAPAA